MSTSMRLTTTERCPFCNSPNISPGEWTHPAGHDLVAICCEDCGMHGPVARTDVGDDPCAGFYFAEALFNERRGVRGGDGQAHHWEVFSTCLGTGELLLRCTRTGAFGVVPDPTAEEWARAFFAPSQPYPWPYASRVVVKQAGEAQPA